MSFNISLNGINSSMSVLQNLSNNIANTPSTILKSSPANVTESIGAETPLINSPGTNELGEVNSSYLENSNTQLETDLVGLLEAQRNFEANVQVIKTIDAVTQTLTNLQED